MLDKNLFYIGLQYFRFYLTHLQSAVWQNTKTITVNVLYNKVRIYEKIRI